MSLTLQDNSNENPYYSVMHNFFNRQVSLSGNLFFLNGSIQTDVGFLGSHMLAKHPRTRQIVFFKNSFKIDDSNKQESLDYLINYFTLSLVAQSFEAFESFIKDLYRKNLSLNIKNEAVLKVTTKNIRSLRNNEVLKLLKSNCPALDEALDVDNISWIQKVEKLRHCIVHTDQTIDEETIRETKHKFIDCYFSFIQLPESNRSRIKIFGSSAKDILDAFQGFAFSIFVLMSENDGYPVLLTPN